ncbi:MAG: hypothetical protein P4L22_02100 [Candidatus Babeliales bacterium]|nr:hypothetical protein [Candidatus Babeliales bacterium]
MVKKTKVVLSFDASNKVAAFFVLLIKVDKSISEATHEKKAKGAKPKKAKTKKDDDIGSLYGELFYFKNETLYTDKRN